MVCFFYSNIILKLDFGYNIFVFEVIMFLFSNFLILVQATVLFISLRTRSNRDCHDHVFLREDLGYQLTSGHQENHFRFLQMFFFPDVQIYYIQNTEYKYRTKIQQHQYNVISFPLPGRYTTALPQRIKTDGKIGPLTNTIIYRTHTTAF